MGIRLQIAVHHEGEKWVVRVAGWLSRDGVGALSEALVGKKGPIRLDLSELRFAERPALGWLQHVRRTGTEIEGASPFISKLLEGAPEIRASGP